MTVPPVYLSTPPGAEEWPWIRLEAEQGSRQGEAIGPSRQYLTPASEASGRQALRLSQASDFVEWTVPAAADGLVLRYSLPDSPNGGGLDAELGLWINGQYRQAIPLTSRYAWIYGNFPWSNDPSEGKAHHFFDEVAVRIPAVKRGDQIRLEWHAAEEGLYCLIDFIDLEQIPEERTRPQDGLSIVEFGATANDGRDDTEALRKCIQAANLSDKTVWIPPGHFHLRGDTALPLPQVRIQGAGMWHSRLQAEKAHFSGTGEPVQVSDLALFGEVDQRIDAASHNAFTGNFGAGSQLENLWIEHVKCGVWTTWGTRNMNIVDCRIRNTMADGVNFCDGTSDSAVLHCHVRNTGDDGLATWSPSGDWSSQKPCQRNGFMNNLVELPWLANGIGIYGGGDHRAEGNCIRETVYSGAGMLISSGHGALPFTGLIGLYNNDIQGAGGEAYIGDRVGGLWLFAQESDIEATIDVRGLRLDASAHAGISMHGPHRIRQLQLQKLECQPADTPWIIICSHAKGRVELPVALKSLPPESIHNHSAEVVLGYGSD
jgi:hypothetical protein